MMVGEKREAMEIYGMEARHLFPGPLHGIFVAFRTRILLLGDDIEEQLAKTQVAYRAERQFAWLSPITKTKALLVLDLWEQHDAPILRNVIRFRDDKVTHQVEVRSTADIHVVGDLGWFEEAVSWGRKVR